MWKNNKKSYYNIAKVTSNDGHIWDSKFEKVNESIEKVLVFCN